MKKLTITFLAATVISCSYAQDFNKNLTTARTAYSGKKLEEARFAMQQMLQELDIAAGKEVMKLLPVKLGPLAFNTSGDDVSGSSGFAGIVIHRDYKGAAQSAQLDIIGNSPLMSSINAILSLPFVASNSNQKVVKLQGYKALLQKNIDTETNTISYELQVPLNSSLLTLKAEKVTEEEMLKFAADLPVAQLAKTLQ